MFGLIGGIITAIVSGIATLATNASNRQMTENLNAQMQAREDNAVQRRAEDLKAAGINPLLAGLGQGAQAQAGQFIPMQNPMANISDIVNSFANVQKNANEKELINNTIEKTKVDILAVKDSIKTNAIARKNIKADTMLKIKNGNLIDDEILNNKFKKDLYKAQVKLANAQSSQAYAAAKYNLANIAVAGATVEKIQSDTRINEANEKMIYQKILNIGADTTLKIKNGQLKGKEIDWYDHKQYSNTIKDMSGAAATAIRTMLIGF